MNYIKINYPFVKNKSRQNLKYLYMYIISFIYYTL